MALALAMVAFVCGCCSRNTQSVTATVGEEPSVKTPPPITPWYGTYDKSGSSLFEISEKAFGFSVLMNGQFRPNVHISPYEIKSISVSELIISGENVKSATHATETYKLVKTDNGASLERLGGVFSGPLGVFRKRGQGE